MTDKADDWLAGDAWTPDGVIRVIREVARNDVRAFSLRVESAGLEIAIDRGGGLPGLAGTLPGREAASPEPDTSASEVPGAPADKLDGVVTAPLLGTFWRRPAPDRPTFVEEGDTIEAGRIVGLIEVMKSFHEVTAPVAGVVTRVLVEDGATVEYGQPLIELDPLQEGNRS